MTPDMEYDLRRLRDQIDSALAMAMVPGTWRKVTVREQELYQNQMHGADYLIGNYLIKVVRDEIDPAWGEEKKSKSC